MAVSFDKGDQAAGATAPTGISVTKAGAPAAAAPAAAAPAAAATPNSPGPQPRPRPAADRVPPVPGPAPAPATPTPTPAPIPRRRYGRVALTAAFLLGAVLAGGIGYALAAASAAEQQRTAAALADSRAAAKAAAKAADAQTSELKSTLAVVSGRLDTASKALSEARSQAAGVAADADRVKAQQADLVKRIAAVEKRERAVAVKEDAIYSFNPGHPLSESIDGDGTWTVGRDIKAGTWSASATDTGCTWRTSDGRHGAGDGSYDLMEVELINGQKFTVHGCSSWSGYSS